MRSALYTISLGMLLSLALLLTFIKYVGFTFVQAAVAVLVTATVIGLLTTKKIK